MTLLPGQDLLRPAIPSLVQPEDFDFLFSDSRAAPKLGQDPDRPAILEVVQIWEGAAMAMAHLRPDGKDLSLGDLHATFTAPGGEGGDRPLFQSKAGLFILRLAPGWTGFLQDGQGQRQPLCAPAAGEDPAEVVLPAGMSAWVDSGHVIFAARHVPPGRRPKAAAGPIDTPFVGALSAVSMLAGLIALVVATSPPPAQAEVAEVPERILQMMLQVPEPSPAPEIKAQATNKEEGAKAKGAEGKAGHKESKMERARGERSAMDRQKLDQQIAEQAGILGHLSDNGALDDVFGSSALNADLQGGIGGLVGAKGVQLGSGGLSSRGSALGGSGPADGIGGVGTKGRNTGDGRYGEEGGTFGDGSAKARSAAPTLTSSPWDPWTRA